MDERNAINHPLVVGSMHHSQCAIEPTRQSLAAEPWPWLQLLAQLVLALPVPALEPVAAPSPSAVVRPCSRHSRHWRCCLSRTAPELAAAARPAPPILAAISHRQTPPLPPVLARPHRSPSSPAPPPGSCSPAPLADNRPSSCAMPIWPATSVEETLATGIEEAGHEEEEEPEVQA